MRKRKVAVLFPAFLGGGAEAVGAWILEALKEEYDVTLITLSDVSLRLLDEQYGTSLRTSRAKVLSVPISLPRFLRQPFLNSLSAFAARQFVLMRAYKRSLYREFDVAVSAFNEMDLGVPGIQYIHLPMFGRGHELVRSAVGNPDSVARRLYRELLRTWSGYSEERMRANLTVANSRWTAAWVQRLYGIQAEVVYPPVVVDVEDIPWQDRENGFVLVARVVPEKKIEVAIRILSEVRRRGYNVHLHVLYWVADRKYLSELKQMPAKCDWVFWEERMSRGKYAKMLATHKYGIHPSKNESFGIGVAEMVLAGVIPFVPSEGGQAEIVGHDSRLMWNDEREAVSKIVEMLTNKELQEQVRVDLKHLATWSATRFKEEIRRVVASFLEGRRGKLS